MTRLKFILIIIFKLICIFSFAQSKVLRGKYGNAVNGNSEFKFYGKDSFSYAHFTCTDGLFGKGRYILEDKTLILLFEKNNCQSNSNVFLKESILPDTSKFYKNLAISFFDNCGNTITKVNPTAIVNNNSKWLVGFKEKKSSDYFQTFDSKVKFIKLRFFCIGYQSKEIGIKMDSSKKVNITLDYDKQDFVSIKNGEIWSFEVKRITDKFIELRRKNSDLAFKKFPKKL
jgi:hypothetical protein